MYSVCVKLHVRGLKLGIYLDSGTATCAGFPGSMFNMQQDAQTLAEWGVDMLKLDGCNVPGPQLPDAYRAFGAFLNQTGRPVLFACSWPADQLFATPPITVCLLLFYFAEYNF